MQEIRCPNCGSVFQVDESGYAQLLQQVRDSEFEKELDRREKEMIRLKENDLKMARMEQERQHDAEMARKDDKLADKDKEIAQLKAELEKADTEKKLAVSEAVSEKEKELSKKANAITELEGKLSNKDVEKELSEKSLREKYESELKHKDEQIEYYKDFKARQSTKMVGESLEQHCMSQFNSLRMTAFPSAYFEKDNDARTGSKGDFIFRDFAADGTEIISIMFEMKNELDETATKHKNEDFFKELDKDRQEKGCEYAVLVSMLEMENEFYNNGIVDVSYRYEKMYVIRPQFFIPIISLLRNATLDSLKYKQELQIVKSQQLDVFHFEENMNNFKDGFAKNYELATKKFQDAIDDIDRTIKALEKTKEDLLSSNRQLRLANDKAQDLSIKKLTKNAPSVRAMFEGGKE
ncbi:MAG: DUF2130 domain-containing protein [Lachnospiraceae bacterium]|nr:DUF2130 domain-containing protein [Lachnospiraceae bacterium]